MNIDFEKLVAEAIATAVEKRIGTLLGPAVRPHDPLACTMAAPSFTLMAPGAPPTRKAKTFTIKYPPWTILRRGRKEALRKFKPGTPCGSAAYAAWEALAKDGVFASKASRTDMIKYLSSELKMPPQRVSATISNALKYGLLTGEVE